MDGYVSGRLQCLCDWFPWTTFTILHQSYQFEKCLTWSLIQKVYRGQTRRWEGSCVCNNGQLTGLIYFCFNLSLLKKKIKKYCYLLCLFCLFGGCLIIIIFNSRIIWNKTLTHLVRNCINQYCRLTAGNSLSLTHQFIVSAFHRGVSSFQRPTLT